MLRFWIIGICLCWVVALFGQEKENTSILYIEPEIMLGKLIPHAPLFPASPLNSGIHLSIGKWNPSGADGWNSFYRHPQYGLDLGCHWFGNKKVVGQQFTLMPYLVIPTSMTWKKGAQIRISGGVNHFTNWYDAVDNPSNKFIGSPLTWAFQIGVHKTWFPKDKLAIKTGINIIHASNGHTTLPNFGLNSIAATISLQYFNKSIPEIATRTVFKGATKHYYLITKVGLGYHELGGPISPIGGNKYMVYTSSMSAAILYKKHILLRAGFSYRNYRSYYNYIKNNSLPEYEDKPILSSSSFIFSIGSEFLIGHFGMDVEVGVNLYKPFYKTHFDVFEKTNQYDKISKGYIAVQLGGNAYLFNTNKMPKHNVFLGVYINANYGQADFASFSLGYVHQLK